MNLKYACAIITDGQGRVLLVKRSEKEDESNKWCPVNETIEEGEDPRDAVIRGVKEEVGMDFQIAEMIETDNTVVARGTAIGQVRLNQDESSDHGYFTYEEALKLDLAFNYSDIIKKIFDLGWIK
jgi:ADP-ribose pyrophosphatase YjhB (NUDIX family)